MTTPTASTTPATMPRAREIAASVLDPELPMVTIEDLGILRDVTEDDQCRVHVTITPTYSGCPAMETIRDDIVSTLEIAVLEHCCVDVRLGLSLVSAPGGIIVKVPNEHLPLIKPDWKELRIQWLSQLYAVWSEKITE